jgi:hypothetical protein
MHRQPHNPDRQSDRVVDKRSRMWVQWSTMTERHQLLAAIIIIS